jgi:hypothetical protein
MKIRSEATLTLRAMLARSRVWGCSPTSRLLFSGTFDKHRKNEGPYSETSVSLAFFKPSAVAFITMSSFSIDGGQITEQVAYVPPDDYLFSGIILENIIMSESEPRMGKINMAASDANILD